MEPKRNIFVKCMSCFGTPPAEEDPEEYIKNNFGSQYTEYEYVIENLAVTPVPKALLDEISANAVCEKKKNRSETIKKVAVPSINEVSDAEVISRNIVPPCEILPDATIRPEDRLKKNKIFSAGGSQDIRYNPCYVHLCSDKNACTECKMGSDNKKDILRRMLVPPGPINPQANPLKPQVIS